MVNFYQTVEDFYKNKLFMINKQYLSFIGRWPFQTAESRKIIMFLICTGYLTILIPEVIYFNGVLQGKEYNVQIMIECLRTLIVTFVSFIIYMNSVVYFEQMKEILMKFRHHWLNLKNEQELRIFQTNAEKGRLLILVFSVALLFPLAVLLGSPLIPRLMDVIIPLNYSRPLETPLKIEYSFDRSKYYWIIYFHNSLSTCGVVFTIVAMDSYFVMIVQNAISMFAVLSYRIDGLNYENNKIPRKYSNKKQENIMYEKVVECMKYHRDCMRFSDLIEASFTISFILQIFLNMIQISLSSVQVLTYKNDTKQMLSTILRLVSYICRLFFVSYCGQKIEDYSSKVHNDVYNVEWYKFPPKTKKLLILIMLRSWKFCYLTAGKIVRLNIETYGNLMNLSWSYFTMLLSMQ